MDVVAAKSGDQVIRRRPAGVPLKKPAAKQRKVSKAQTDMEKNLEINAPITITNRRAQNGRKAESYLMHKSAISGKPTFLLGYQGNQLMLDR